MAVLIQVKLHNEAAEMLQRCVHAFARGALPFRPVKSPLCSGLAGCCLCCARASAARSRLPRSGCTLSMRSSATLRELEEFRVYAVHIEILASSKGPFGSQLFTLCARTLTHGSHGGGARTSICPHRVITCSSKVGENATRAHPDGNHTGWQPGDLIPRPRRAAVRRLGLLFVHLFAPAT